MESSENFNSPIVCDLDGTLIATDLLVETFSRTLKRFWFVFPFIIIYVLYLFLVGGIAKVKVFLAKYGNIDPNLLPYRGSILSFLKKSKQDGRRVILASASSLSLLQDINSHLKLFSEIYGTSESINLKGNVKRDLLISKFGKNGYDYIGDSKADIPVWLEARNSYAVTTNTAYIRYKKSVLNLELLEKTSETTWISILKMLRVHQWLKNLLLFVPMFTAHRWSNIQDIIGTIAGFCSFSLIASSVYILNDLSDLDVDRAHRNKRHRPFASGSLSVFVGLIFLPLLWFLGFKLSFSISIEFTKILILYFTLTTLYSFVLKKIALVDIIVLASLYTLRVYAGSILSEAPISHWLAAFSMFIFFSLASVKRYTELYDAKKQGTDGRIKGRGYHSEDLEIIGQFGITSGYLSVLVLALYIQGEEVRTLYSRPEVLWGICPLFFYWISRIWLKASRNSINEDPVLFAAKDKGSYITAVLLILIILLAKYLK